jgi:hypothetical protein
MQRHLVPVGIAMKRADRIWFSVVGVLLLVSLALSALTVIVVYWGVGESEMDRIFREVPQNPPLTPLPVPDLRDQSP